MKKTKFILLFLALVVVSNFYAQIGIGTTEPDPSSRLDVSANDRGFLPPRLSTSERNNISNPANGLVIYNITINCLQWFNGGFWFNPCDGSQEAAPNSNLTVANPTYQGISVIDSQGIGYNGEIVPTASTITVQLTNTSSDTQSFGITATDPASGLTFSASGTIAGGATIPVVLTHNEPDIDDFFAGTITMSLLGVSNTLNLEPRIDIKSIPTTHPDWTYENVTYGTQIWMDRNLGARRVATSINDIFSYGNHYQWGRPADGHEINVWNGDDPNIGRGFFDAVTTLATSDTPGIPNFITTNASPNDWRSDNNANRWAIANQGPCPSLYHVPSTAEWVAAAGFNDSPFTSGGSTTGIDDRFEGFESRLKLPSAGYRFRSDNELKFQVVNPGDSGTGRYWSSESTNAGDRSRDFSLFNSNANPSDSDLRANGWSIRCIRD